MEQYASLTSLKPGKKGTIHRITGDLMMKRRLASLGFIKGSEVAVGHSALLGDPRSYSICGYQVSLRKNESNLVDIIHEIK